MAERRALLNSLPDRTESVVLRASALIVLAIIALTFVQVVLRYFFGSPISWIEEISRSLFAWIVMLGSAVAFRSDQHIRIDTIDRRFPRHARLLGVLRRLLVILAILLLFYSGAIVSWRNRYSNFFTLPDLPAVLFYLSVPVGALLMVFFVVFGKRGHR